MGARKITDTQVPREPTFLDRDTSGLYPDDHVWDVGDGKTITDAEVRKADVFGADKQKPPGKPAASKSPK